MNKLHRPGLTLWHTFMACALVAMSTSLTCGEEGYSVETAAAHTQLVDSARDTRPVTLRKKGYVIYDSGRAETIAELWNIGDLAEAEALLALLDRKRFLESKR